ncbi:hypothetical protein MNBD_NITROSPINAE02-1524 [hydrothermal vent metagenome]|uniref:TfoX N-terminal domain-containing protein n=1 Tax=hydrothermal vent metagenome TaxID=652676 RepID=A0A3B1C1P4_9ZZZZ
MTSEYQNRLSLLLKIHRPRLATTHKLEFKNCFGAVAGYVEGAIFITCGQFGLALKLPAKTVDSVMQDKGGKPLKYFPNGHVKKDYVVIPERILENYSEFKKLINQSIRHSLR